MRKARSESADRRMLPELARSTSFVISGSPRSRTGYDSGLSGLDASLPDPDA